MGQYFCSGHFFYRVHGRAVIVYSGDFAVSMGTGAAAGGCISDIVTAIRASIIGVATIGIVVIAVAIIGVTAISIICISAGSRH